MWGVIGVFASVVWLAVCGLVLAAILSVDNLDGAGLYWSLAAYVLVAGGITTGILASVLDERDRR